jgi:hypothetical protein
MLLEEFLSRVEKTPFGCWLWTGYCNPKGYGSARYNGRAQPAHRVAYFLLVGEIPRNKPELDHLCNTRSCVNPSHLEPVTRKENCRRASERQLYCKHGHEYTPLNTLWRVWDGYTKRYCRECNRISCLNYYNGRKAA